jgi:transcriptional regulator with XRE-family HTH domain
MPQFPMKCAICRERRTFPVTELYETTVEHDGRSYQLSIPDLNLLKCEACGNRILPDAADDRVSDALRIAAGFLHPSVIKEQRLRLGLTQSQLAGLLCVGEATLCRWETGGQIQSHHMDVMLRAFFGVPAFREYLEAKVLTQKGVDAKPSRTAVNASVKMTLTQSAKAYPYVSAFREDSNKIESGV